jgi:hypothetical protein
LIALLAARAKRGPLAKDEEDLVLVLRRLPREQRKELEAIAAAARDLDLDRPAPYFFIDAFLSGDMAALCRPGAVSIVEALLDAGVPVDARCRRLPMASSASSGAVDIIRLLHARGARIDDSVDPSQRNTALHLAAGRGEHLAVRALLDLGADPHARNARDFTPFDAAAGREPYKRGLRPGDGHSLAMEMLFAAMGEPSTVAPWSKLSIAVRCGRDAVVAELVAAAPADASNPWLVELALKHNHARVLRVVLAAGCRVTEADLCCAASAAVLLEALRSTAAKGSLVLSVRPLLAAIDRSDADSISLLLAAGSPVNVAAACLAAQHRQYDALLKLLLVAGLVVSDFLRCISDSNDAKTKWRNVLSDTAGLANAQRHIVRVGLPLIRARAVEICVALQARALDALCMTQIIEASVAGGVEWPSHCGTL